jgi:hypothetical protein
MLACNANGIGPILLAARGAGRPAIGGGHRDPEMTNDRSRGWIGNGS